MRSEILLVPRFHDSEVSLQFTFEDEADFMERLTGEARVTELRACSMFRAILLDKVGAGAQFVRQVGPKRLMPIPIAVQFHPQVEPDPDQTDPLNSNPRISAEGLPINVLEPVSRAELVNDRPHLSEVRVQSFKVRFECGCVHQNTSL